MLQKNSTFQKVGGFFIDFLYFVVHKKYARTTTMAANCYKRLGKYRKWARSVVEFSVCNIGFLHNRTL